jgi:hypothetical protein
MRNRQDRVAIFKQAVLYVADRGGEDAVLRAFGEPGPVDEAWGLSLPEFKLVLRARIREGLRVGRGAA